jgi:hypothetical protein
VGHATIRADIENLKKAMASSGIEEGFMCSIAPGSFARGEDLHYKTEEEFVFGAFASPQLKVSTQVSIRSIEARSGISFGKLASVDPLAGAEEGLGGEAAGVLLEALEQIRFF